VTAFLALRLLRSSHWLAKIAAMIVSYAAWIVATFSGYVLLGGGLGLMEGGGMLVFLSFTALVSSFLYLLAWLTVWAWRALPRPAG
jgi:hypothetical protein